jgi:phage terminase large subunit-like protein
MSSDVWMGCEENFDPDELEGEECYGGLDLSGSRDLTALALFFPKQRKLLVEFWTKIPCWNGLKRTGYLMTPGSAMVTSTLRQAKR